MLAAFMQYGTACLPYFKLHLEILISTVPIIHPVKKVVFILPEHNLEIFWKTKRNNRRNEKQANNQMKCMPMYIYFRVDII